MKKILFWVVGIIVGIVLALFITAHILRYNHQIQMKKSAEFVRVSDSLCCECDKKLNRDNMRNGNYIDYGYYERYTDELEWETREYYQQHYGVEFEKFNPKEDTCVDRYMMDRVIEAKFGKNFYKLVYETNRKIGEKHAGKTEPDSYFLGSDLIYDKKEFERFQKYIEMEMNKSFPNLSKLPPCYPSRIEYVAYIGAKGTVDSCFIIHKLSPAINKRLMELISKYPHKFKPCLKRDSKKPVIVEIRECLWFKYENPYFVHVE